MYKFILMLSLFLATTSLYGCGREDISNSRDFAPFVGTTWKTKVPISLAKVDGLLSGQECSAEYEQEFMRGTANRNSFDGQHLVTAILPAGTIIRIERLFQLLTDEGGIYVEVSVQNGTYKGKTIKAPNNIFASNRFLHPEDTSKDSIETWDGNPDKLEKY